MTSQYLETANSDKSQRILDATARCAMKYSLQRTTIDDVSKESGVSRATIYRLFAGGRDEVISRTVAHQLNRFLAALREEVAEARDLEAVLVAALMSAHRLLAEHELFHRVMEVEPEILLPWLTSESGRVIGLLKGFITPLLGSEQQVGPGGGEAYADYIARLFLSYVESPGSIDLQDKEAVAELVRSQFIRA